MTDPLLPLVEASSHKAPTSSTELEARSADQATCDTLVPRCADDDADTESVVDVDVALGASLLPILEPGKDAVVDAVVGLPETCTPFNVTGGDRDPDPDTDVPQQEIEASSISNAEPPEPTAPEPSSSPPVDVTTMDAPSAAALVQDFLYYKILDNQCSSHAKEIHEFLAVHMSEARQRQELPEIISQLSAQLQQQATVLNSEVSVDIQTSLCLLEQSFSLVGRRSPLADMYTEEEEEMLNQY